MAAGVAASVRLAHIGRDLRSEPVGARIAGQKTMIVPPSELPSWVHEEPLGIEEDRRRAGGVVLGGDGGRVGSAPTNHSSDGSMLSDANPGLQLGVPRRDTTGSAASAGCATPAMSDVHRQSE